MSIWLAVQAMNGTGYKYMLFGNASTVFFPEAALQLLEDFDAELPYIITNGLIWRNASGADMPDKAPRCLPCHFDDSDGVLRLSQGVRQSPLQVSHRLTRSAAKYHAHLRYRMAKRQAATASALSALLKSS